MNIKRIDNGREAQELTTLINNYNNLKWGINNLSQVYNGKHFVIIDSKGKVLGGIGYRLHSWYLCEIYHLVMSPKYREKGFGKELIKFLLDKKLSYIYAATIYKNNTSSISLFYSLGFDRVAEITPKENLYLKETK